MTEEEAKKLVPGEAYIVMPTPETNLFEKKGGDPVKIKFEHIDAQYGETIIRYERDCIYTVGKRRSWLYLYNIQWIKPVKEYKYRELK